MKYCSLCARDLPLSSFPSNRSKFDGLQTNCRECHNAKVRANKEARLVWHECPWCGSERRIDRRNITADLVCRNDQRLDLLQRSRARQHMEAPVRALRRAKTHGASVLREIKWAYARVVRELDRASRDLTPGKFAEPVTRECPNCECHFDTLVPRQVYCSLRCSRRAQRGRNGGRFWVSDARRLTLYERDGWACQLCTRRVFPWGSPALDWMSWATLDHILPRSLGGSDDDSNLRVACYRCNSLRSNDVEWEFTEAA